MQSNMNIEAKSLRKRLTDAENVLRKHLRAKQIGCQSRRQEPIGNYIVDFVCYEKRVVIEVDGGQHTIEKVSDNERDAWLREEGPPVLSHQGRGKIKRQRND